MGGGDKGEARSCGQGEARSCGRRVEFDGTLEDLLLGCRCSECATPVPHDHVLCSACSGKGQAGKGHDYAPDAPIPPWRYTTIPLPLPGFPPHNKGRVWRGCILGKSKNKGKGKGHPAPQSAPSAPAEPTNATAMNVMKATKATPQLRTKAMKAARATPQLRANYAQWERQQLCEKHAKDSRGQEKEAYDTAAMRQGEVDAWARYGLTGSHDDEECQCPNCVAASVRGRELEAQLSATQLEATQLDAAVGVAAWRRSWTQQEEEEAAKRARTAW
jgi:hypothetical protein